MERPDWSPEGIDLDRPSVARIYDHWLGGAHNFAVDREMSRKILELMPDLQYVARANRAFLHRAVRFMVDAGIRQFLDIGSGIPTVGNVHEIAQRAAPETRVVYVDIDPVAVAHSEHILADNDLAAAIQEDFRHPRAILEHSRTRTLLDFDQPVGLLLVALLHYVPDEDDPYAILARVRDVLSPGSYVAIGHATADERPREVDEVQRMSRRTGTPLTARPRAVVERFFTGLDLLAPGLVWAPQWRPDAPDDVGDRPERSANYVGVGRVP